MSGTTTAMDIQRLTLVPALLVSMGECFFMGDSGSVSRAAFQRFGGKPVPAPEHLPFPVTVIEFEEKGPTEGMTGLPCRSTQS